MLMGSAIAPAALLQSTVAQSSFIISHQASAGDASSNEQAVRVQFAQDQVTSQAQRAQLQPADRVHKVGTAHVIHLMHHT
jgi:hypothetical protein